MSFVLNTNICSAHIVRPGGLAHRFIQYVGRLYAYQRPDPTSLLAAIETDLLADVELLTFDMQCAEVFGRVRGTLLRTGITISAIDMQIAAVAIVQDHTLVTHNVAHFRHIPGLRIDHWLAP
jgi:tRNA(fMet)-specific endonuclease VapC